MKKSNVYTRTGDKGETSLVSGARVSKGNIQIDLYGDVDELNAHIGVLIQKIKEEKVLTEDIINSFFKIQNEMFNLGSLLACEPQNWEKFKLTQLSTELISTLESQIDQMDSELEPLKNFILPGGSSAGSYSHIVRTICRRVERKLILYVNEGHEIPNNSSELLNRFSDFVFVVGRKINSELKISETLWTNN